MSDFFDWWLGKVVFLPMNLAKGRSLPIRVLALLTYVIWFFVLIPITFLILFPTIISAGLEEMK